MCEKQQLRKEIKSLKLGITPELRTSWARLIGEAVEALPEFSKAQHILLYHALPDEVETAFMLDSWRDSKQLYLPVVEGNNLIIKPYYPNQLQQGAFGIWEPANVAPVDPAILDLIIVPGVAFDERLNRLGRGKGYYDRLLSHTRACTVAIAYELQVLDQIPTEPHDITMDIIVTEKRTIYKKQSSWH